MDNILFHTILSLTSINIQSIILYKNIKHLTCYHNNYLFHHLHHSTTNSTESSSNKVLINLIRNYSNSKCYQKNMSGFDHPWIDYNRSIHNFALEKNPLNHILETGFLVHIGYYQDIEKKYSLPGFFQYFGAGSCFGTMIRQV